MSMGVICGLTGEQADFDPTCSNYSEDEELAEKAEALSENTQRSKKQNLRVKLILLILLLGGTGLYFGVNFMLAKQKTNELAKLASKMGALIVEELNEGKPTTLDYLIDGDMFMRRATTGRKISAAETSEVAELYREHFRLGTILLGPGEAVTDFHLADEYPSDNDDSYHVVIRRYTNGYGFDYYDLDIKLLNNDIKVVEIYNYLGGTALSQSIGRMLPKDKNANKTKDGTSIQKINHLVYNYKMARQGVIDGDYDPITEYYQNFDDKHKGYQLFGQLVDLMMQIDHPDLRDALDDIREFGSQDYRHQEYWELKALMHYQTYQGYGDLLENFDPEFVFDPLQDLVLSRKLVAEGSYDDASTKLLALQHTYPDNSDIDIALLDVLCATERYEQCVNDLYYLANRWYTEPVVLYELLLITHPHIVSVPEFQPLRDRLALIDR